MMHIISGRLYPRDSLLGTKFMVYEIEGGSFEVQLTSASTGEQLDQCKLESAEELGSWLLDRVDW